MLDFRFYMLFHVATQSSSARRSRVNKTELIEATASAAGTSKADTERVINSVISEIEAIVRKGEKVTIPGFGTFSLTERKARIGRNPQTGESIKIAASKAPKFTAGSSFKATVNSKGKAAKAAPAKAAVKPVAKSVAAKPGKAPAKKGK